MARNLITTKSLVGKRVVDAKKHKRIGKVRRFVFHPSERRCVGLLVKRPDAALMFHRKDLFVSLGGYDMEDGELVVHDDAAATDRGAIKALGLDWDACVIWVGMPVLTKSGDFLGYVDEVSFDAQTGEVAQITTDNGAANNAILGRRAIPGLLVLGFKRGVGAALAPVGAYDGQDPEELGETGAILVADDAAGITVEGGVAAAAGKATAVVADKAKKGSAKATAKAKPVAQKAAKATEAAAEKGSYALGKQLGRASGMFAAFKEEYDKAAHGDGGDK